MALNKDRNTPYRDGSKFEHPVKGATRINAGAIVVLGATGFAAPGSTAVGLTIVGVAETHVDNLLGADGDAFVRIRRGVFLFAEAATDPLNRTHIGKTCFVADDETVAATSGGDTRSPAGKVLDVDADGGVWVEIG